MKERNSRICCPRIHCSKQGILQEKVFLISFGNETFNKQGVGVKITPEKGYSCNEQAECENCLVDIPQDKWTFKRNFCITSYSCPVVAFEFSQVD